MTSISLTPLLVAMPLSAMGTWLLAGAARRIGAVAKVTADRWHKNGEIPRLAGPAMLAAVAPWLHGGELAILMAVCALGSIDDIRPLRPDVKAIGLLMAAAAAVWVTGSWWTGPALWLVANAVNLLDHADGIAAAAAAGTFLGLGGDAGLAAAGACGGFLLLNYPPARVFMGDSGSLTLGAMAVLIGARGNDAVTTALWCAVPLADAVQVTVRRILRGQKPWVGGTDHSGHGLLRMGIPPRLLPALYFILTLLAGAVSGIRP
ncbi:MraY family glycosyltransferase [Magnetospirillum sp. 15-1]|uniref:MraY family glycosyltransferase n=1 Tax=Magnetospirillum sp. 15-1 TaxID=1979370 RepID=UPI000BBBEC3D|nr:MraY family glycosyltransferase [Magnetospirillum sp. 15-1]